MDPALRKATALGLERLETDGSLMPAEPREHTDAESSFISGEWNEPLKIAISLARRPLQTMNCNSEDVISPLRLLNDLRK
ncbi:hypothetical protein [Rhodopseudomonas palustris]|uniref:hypothetical protein n=1 Tax=Rhodopseudomonas palustris TaxID=1076 RepID=UPI0011C35A5D|nr:hypothetical protein [Rhodopseudomonas palustris]